MNLAFRKMLLSVLISVTYVLCPAIAADEMQNSTSANVDNPSQYLHNVRKIFIAPLGADEGSELIRQKIINRLIGHGYEGIAVVDSANGADATLVGSAQINNGIRLANGTGGTRCSAELVARLIGKSQQVLWTDEVQSKSSRAKLRPGHGGNNSADASSEVADKIVRDLLQAIAGTEGNK